MALPRIHTILNPQPPSLASTSPSSSSSSSPPSTSITRTRKPAVLDIANLLCSDDEPSPYWDTSPTASSSTQSRMSSPAFVYNDERSYQGLRQDGPSSDQARHRPTAFRHPATSYAYTPSSPESYLNRSPSPYQSPSPRYSSNSIKAKRKRASAGQLDVLNRVFAQTFFPSTEMRNELAKQLSMSPRTVQIWFQNKRQSIRTRERSQQQSSQDKRDERRYNHSLPTPPLSSVHDGANGYIDATP